MEKVFVELKAMQKKIDDNSAAISKNETVNTD